MLVWGIKESSNFNAIMVLIKILVLLFFIGTGALLRFAGDRWRRTGQPFQPQGWMGTFTGAAVVFFAYIGFDAVQTVAEETKNPARDLPIGIIASLIICTILYVVVAAVFTGMVPWETVRGWTSAQRGESLTMALETRRAAGVVAEHGHRFRIGGRAHGGVARVSTRPTAHLLFDGARWIAAVSLRERSSEIQDTTRHDDSDRRRRRRHRGVCDCR